MRIPGVSWACELIRTGQGGFLLAEIWMRFYKEWRELLFAIKYRLFGSLPGVSDFQIQLETKNPIAYESPDHLNPWGTSRDNSTNKKFVESMAKRIKSENPGGTLGALDLGCSGGQLVKDFADFGWMTVGLEGSDFSLKHRRANWSWLADKNLFTCDITKPFQIKLDGRPARFHLITAWEVMEHIPTTDLPQVFRNIRDHLEPGGYFIASTTETSDIHEGLELHQTRWTNPEWRQFVAEHFPDLEYVDTGLKTYQYVRYNFLHPSFLLYRKKGTK